MTATAERPAVVAIVGPTGVGKSAVAERLASLWAGEIVSADSMQVYRRMDVGTAKPRSPTVVPYHCIGLVDPGCPYSAALYQRDARAAIDSILSRGAQAIVCGGTGLYIRAALDDWDFPEGELESPVRERLEEEAALKGADHMHARLQDADPEAASAIHPHNVRRVVRALEMAEGGSSYAHQAAAFRVRRPVYDVRFVGLTMDRAALYARIDARVDGMVSDGLLEEVARLLEEGSRDALTSSQAIGYKELVPVLDGSAELQQALDDVKRASRRFAKRQLTWFRGDRRVEWIDVTGISTRDAVRCVAELVESAVRPDEGDPQGTRE